MTHTKIFGPPGTGKTTYLLDIVDKAIRAGVEPERIAYMAFTKKAADEASTRAITRFGLPKERLPWFRTLHSMAFKTLGVTRQDIMQESHYKEIGYELGFKFSDLDSVCFVPAGTTLGDKVARLESLSRLRCVGLEDQWIECNFRDVDLAAARQWDAGVKRYKQTNGLMDYTDLLEQFTTSLDVDLFILDEAQDLSPLQWKVVEMATAGTKEVYMAGDDDQCIYDWAGASPAHFINHTGEVKVLPQSYRIPRQIQRVAQGVTDNMRERQPKQWNPREAEGRFERVRREELIDLSKGTWLLLARNHQTLSRFENLVQSQGYPYMKEGNHSTDNALSKAILSWERWRKGLALEGKDVRNLGRFVPALEAWQPRSPTLLTEAPLPEAFKARTWMDVIEIAPRKREYIRSCLANGESLFGKPRITISTIHRAKGGEADHVVLIPDITQNPWNQLHTDSEMRVLYVAVTRAKESLTIVQPNSPRHYLV